MRYTHGLCQMVLIPREFEHDSSLNLCKKKFLFQLQREQIIYDHFSNPMFISQLIEFLSLEDRKGKDKFNPRRFCLFKVQAQRSNCKVCLIFMFATGQC